MDTKWRKSKAWAGLLAFVLGVSLLLQALFGIARQRAYSNGDWGVSDYQETSSFRSHVAARLGQFIAMAVGGPVNTSNYSYQNVDGVWYYSTYAGETIAEAVEQGDWEWFDSPQAAAGSVDGEDSPADRADSNREQAAAFHARIKEDQNLLYVICGSDNKVMYTNVPEGKALNGSSGQMPEGYNFLLYYCGGKVTITKDGQKLDIYGDGFYGGDSQWSQWYVPGYQNFQVDDAAEAVTVALAAREVPQMYIKGNYTTSGSEQQGNQLYWIANDLKQSQEEMKRLAVEGGVGIFLLVVYLLLRKDKAQADRWAARVTGKVWLEVKLALLWAALRICWPGSSYLPYLLHQLRCGMSYGPDYWYEIGYAWREYLWDILRYPMSLIPIFWVIYFLFLNDIRYHERGKYRSFFRSLYRSLRAKDLTRPIQKRMARQEVLLAGAACLLVVPAGVFLGLMIEAGGDGDTFLLGCLLVLSAGAILLAAALLLRLRSRFALARDLGALADQIEQVRQGNLTEPLALPRDTDLARMAEDLNSIQEGLSRAVEERTRSERMKVELITNVSHDLKTPLTSIISYTELLRQEEGLPDHVRDYIRILQEKAARLKSIVQDVFDVSKASAGQLPVNLKRLDLAKLLRQTVADMSEAIDRSPVSLRTNLPEEPVMIRADGDRLYRVFQNLLQNALSYSLEGSRIYLTLQDDGTTAVACVKNTSKDEIREDADFTARFVRGDESRTDGGNGLGLSIAKSFTEACGGTLSVEPIADLFVVRVTFSKDADQSAPEELDAEYRIEEES